MKVAVTGATGFTGSYLVPLLLRDGHQVRCLVRDPSRIPSDWTVEIVPGDLDRDESLKLALDGCDALVNLASLGFGHAARIVDAAVRRKISRAVFISTTAIFTTLNAPSKQIRKAAEESIRGSELSWTILRPTMIYGSSRDRNISRLISFLRRSPVMPIFGGGNHLQQPVYVGDVAAAIRAALWEPRTFRNAYNLSGALPLSFNQIVDTVARLLRRRVFKVHVPAAPFIAVTRTVERIGMRFSIRSEQIARLNEDKAFSHEEARRDFAYQPISFEEGIRAELEEMGIALARNG